MVRRKHQLTTTAVVTTGASLSLLALCFLGPSTMSFLQVLALLVSIGFGAVLPGYCITTYSQPVTRTERFLLAAIYGTMLWSLGVFFASLFGLDLIRYMPSLLCCGWSLNNLRNSKESGYTARKDGGDVAVIVGGMAGLVALLPSLTKTLSLQRTSWLDYWSFHIDLPFHISLVSEAAQRIPTVYPYADDTELRYTWLTHASLGFLSRVSQVSAFDLVLQFWPIMAAVILSFLIAAMAWKATSSFLVTLAAPIIAACLRGPRLGSSSYLDFHLLAPYSLSRDLGTIWLISLVLHLMQNQAKVLDCRKTISIDIAIVLFVTFSLSGGKGSMLPLVLGSLFGAAFVILMQTRKLLYRPLRVIIASSAGLVMSQVLVVKSSGHLQIDLFSFTDAIPGVTNKWSLVWLAVPVSLAFLVPLHMYLERPKVTNLGLWMLALLPLVGLGGLTVLGHPGKSQLIFWMTTIPFFAVGLAILLGFFYRHSDGTERFIALATGLSSVFVGKVTHQASEMRQLALVIIACSVGMLIVVLRRMKLTSNGRLIVWSGIPVIGVLLIGGLQFQVDPGLTYDTGPSPGGQVALHQEQLFALKLLRSQSSPSERFITNKHCIVGSVVNQDCYSRWFLATAISERRTPIEGYSYTWRNVDGPYWNSPSLARFDSFIANPTIDERNRLLSEGVRWVFIDTKEPFSNSLADVSTLVYSGEFAKLYHLG